MAMVRVGNELDWKVILPRLENSTCLNFQNAMDTYSDTLGKLDTFLSSLAADKLLLGLHITEV